MISSPGGRRGEMPGGTRVAPVIDDSFSVEGGDEAGNAAPVIRALRSLEGKEDTAERLVQEGNLQVRSGNFRMTLFLKR